MREMRTRTRQPMQPTNNQLMGIIRRKTHRILTRSKTQMKSSTTQYTLRIKNQLGQIKLTKNCATQSITPRRRTQISFQTLQTNRLNQRAQRLRRKNKKHLLMKTRWGYSVQLLLIQLANIRPISNWVAHILRKGKAWKQRVLAVKKRQESQKRWSRYFTLTVRSTQMSTFPWKIMV